MGNCNYKLDIHADESSCKATFPYILFIHRNKQVGVQASQCDRKRRLWQSVEGRTQKVQNYVRHERDVQSQDRDQKVRELCTQRKETFGATQTPVSTITLHINFVRFLINMFYAFMDYENIYLVTDLVTGGDIRYH
jgi:hypothetical protein